MTATPETGSTTLAVVGLPSELRASGIWAASLLHALARDEVAGRRSQRLTEARLDVPGILSKVFYHVFAAQHLPAPSKREPFVKSAEHI